MEDFEVFLDEEISRCRIFASSPRPFDAISFGLTYDPSKLLFERFERGSALAALEFEPCFLREVNGKPSGLVLGCVTTLGEGSGPLAPNVRHHIGTVVFRPGADARKGDVLPVSFTSELGSPPVEVLLANRGFEMAVATTDAVGVVGTAGESLLEIEDFQVSLDGEESICRIFATSYRQFDAFSFGVQFDSSLLSLERFEVGEALSDLPFDPCFHREVEGGLVTGCVTALGEGARPLPRGERHHVATLVFRATENLGQGESVPLRLSRDLGDPPVDLLLSDAGFELEVATRDGVGTTREPRVLRVPEDYPNIQEAVDVAEDGDIVELSRGTFSGNGNVEVRWSELELTIRGAGDELSVIDGESAASFGFEASSGELVLRDLAVVRTLDRAVQLESVQCVAELCRVSRNAGLGWSSTGGELTLVDCRAEGNEGGGLRVEQATLQASRCEFRSNQGFGVSFGATSSASFENSSITGTVEGSAVEFSTGAELDATFRFCTIAGNEGPGIDEGDGAGAVELVASIVWGNDTLHTGADENLVASHSCVQGGLLPGEGNISLDPEFNSDYSLGSNSPCLDLFFENTPGVDLLGNERACGSGADLGAVEFCAYYRLEPTEGYVRLFLHTAVETWAGLVCLGVEDGAAAIVE
ncbi:MAG: right-handed parallel beta-helix repeat-containing protein, partial [Planctomycetota bacterium]